MIKRHKVALLGTVVDAYSQNAWSVLQEAFIELIDLIRKYDLAGQCRVFLEAVSISTDSLL